MNGSTSGKIHFGRGGGDCYHSRSSKYWLTNNSNENFDAQEMLHE